MRPTHFLLAASSARAEVLRLASAPGGSPWQQSVVQLCSDRRLWGRWVSQQYFIFAALEQCLRAAPPCGAAALWHPGLERAKGLSDDTHFWNHGQSAGLLCEADAAAVRDYLGQLGTAGAPQLTAHHAVHYGPLLDVAPAVQAALRRRYGLYGGDSDGLGLRFLQFPALGSPAGEFAAGYRARLGELPLSDADWEAAAEAAGAVAALRQRQVDCIIPADAPPQQRSSPPPMSRGELHRADGAGGGRILVCLRGKVYDVSDGRAHYGEGGPYAALAGRDVTRALATMDLSPQSIGDFGYVPKSEKEEASLRGWEQRLAAKYPVVAELAP
eukprot:TRINITY_DN24970_c0_g1_i1.p2 TRINITY_DN24970_c0_g1~~TRINITY_DN24970_c0_g1_i1.p2  ORF type:complete len:328 (+),score=88.13 TRINITY_DN24970_c0_g1_i1:96-1079(+)